MKVCYIYNHDTHTHTQILQHDATYCPNYCSQHLICLLNPRISPEEKFLLYKTDLCKPSFTSCSIFFFFLRPTKRKIGVNFGVNFGVDFPGKVYSGFQTLPRRTHLRPLQNPPGALGPRLGAGLKGCGSSGVTGLADPSELCTSLPSPHPGTRRCYSEICHGGNIYTTVICKCCKLGPGPLPKASCSTLTSTPLPGP